MSSKNLNEFHSLGKYYESYLPRAVPGKVMLSSAIGCGLLCALELITAVNKYLGPPNTILSDRYRKDAILTAAILGMIFFLLAVALGALYYAHKKHRVDLYESGIVVVTWRGSVFLPWYNISDLQILPIYGRARKPVNWDFTVIRDDGVKVRFRGLENLEALGRIVSEKLSKEQSQRPLGSCSTKSV